MRARTEFSGAVPVSASHYMDRNGKGLEQISRANDSLECRNCHNYAMDFTRQSVRAQAMHSTHLANQQKTCIDCHKGIAHSLPYIPPGKGPSDSPGQAPARGDPQVAEPVSLPASAAR